MMGKLGSWWLLGLLLGLLTGKGPMIALAQGQDHEPKSETSFSVSHGSEELPKVKGAFLGYQKAIEIGLEQHPLIRKAQRTAMAAKTVAEQLKAKYYPQVDAIAIQTGGTIRPLSAFNIGGAQNKPTSYIQEAGLRADQLIYDFGQTGHQILAEQARQNATEKRVLTNNALVILRVQQAYFQCQRQSRLVDIAEKIVRERGVIRDQVALLYKRQLRPKLDLSMISIELKSAEIQLVQAKNELRAAFATLNNTMGIQGPDEYTLESVPVDSFSKPLDSLIQGALKDRPELMSKHDLIRQANEHLQAARALHLPTINALGTYGVIHFSDAPTNQFAGAHPGFTQQFWGVGARLSIPLFTGFLIENRVAEAQENKYKVEKELHELFNGIALEVTDAYLTRQAAKQQIKVERQELEAATSAFALARIRYKRDLASIVELARASTALLAAEVRLSEAKYAFQVSDAALLYAIGKGYKQFPLKTG